MHRKLGLVKPPLFTSPSAIEVGHKALVFSQFVSTLKILSGELKPAGTPFCYLDGSTKDRLGECNRFNRDPKILVFLISLMTGGTGLNLTSAASNPTTTTPSADPRLPPILTICEPSDG